MTPFRGLAGAEDAAVLRAALNSVRRGVHWQREDCDDSEDLESGWRETDPVEPNQAPPVDFAIVFPTEGISS